MVLYQASLPTILSELLIDFLCIGNDVLVGSLASDGTYHTAQDSSYLSESEGEHQESTVAAGMKMPEPVIFTPGPSSRTSSIIASIHSEEHISFVDYDAGYESPPPIDTRIAELKNERRYRMLLTHDYHPSRACFHFILILTA